jgi:hypothetical protein
MAFGPMHGHGPLQAPSEHLGDGSEGVIGLLNIAGLLPLWQLDV